LVAREATQRPRDNMQVSSFSRLAAGESEHARAPEGLDRDEQAAVDMIDQLDAASNEAVALAEFPAGAAFGHLIHAIYEHADFEAKDVAALYPCVDDALRDFGAAAFVRSPLRAAEWREPLATAVLESLRAPLSRDALPSLAHVSNDRRSNELEFLFPVASRGLPLSAAALGRLLREYARDSEERAYGARLANLRFTPFRGFVRGFIDLVVEHDHRFYVIDYKSNHLGPSANDYRPERLGPVMRRHHYVLQSLVYSVALHRHLSLRLRDYDYDQHFGGSYYLFIRGLSDRHPAGSGVFFDRPVRELVERLSALFSEPGSL
jgi:exodeoxyribonuclease V beta subunit